MTASLNHFKHNPAVSWLLATRYDRGCRPGTVAIWWRTSVRLNGTSQAIHDVVLMVMWASYGATAPEPRKAVWRSGTPHTTGTGGIPSASPTSGRTVPSTLPVATNSGSRSRSRPERRTSSGTYERFAPGRVSVRHDRIIEGGVAATRPVNLRPR